MRAVHVTALLLTLTASSAYADLQTLHALRSANVPLTLNQTRSISAATGNTLAAALAKLARHSPDQVAAITSASVPLHPELATTLVAALVKAAPERLNDILEAAISAAPDQATELATLVSDLLPTAAGDRNQGLGDGGTGVPSVGNAGTANNPNTASPS
ncbi:hypothetical protein ACVW0Y_003618 [Pseudomonas sp. TE3786]